MPKETLSVSDLEAKIIDTNARIDALPAGAYRQEWLEHLDRDHKRLATARLAEALKNAPRYR